MRCIISGHENFDTCGICLEINCTFISRLVCPKCLVGYHNLHMESILLFNDILDNKQKDFDYLKMFPEVDQMNMYLEEGTKNKTASEKMTKIIESNSSSIYDLILNNFDNLNSCVKKEVDETLKLNLDHMGDIMSRFEEFGLYENTSQLMSKQISVKDLDNIINSSIIQNLKEIKSSVQKLNIGSRSLSGSSGLIPNLIPPSQSEKVEKVSKKINTIYIELKSDLLNLFRKYTAKVSSIAETTNNTSFKFIISPYNKNVTQDDIYHNQTSMYTLKGKNLCLVGDTPLNCLIERYKIVIEKPTSFSCCGFGIGSLDDPNLLNSSLSGNNNNVLLCLCCNGPWSAKSMKILNTNNKLGPALFTDDKKEIYFELNRIEEKFKIFDNNNILHAEICLANLTYKENLTPILNCTSGVTFSFKIVIE